MAKRRRAFTKKISERWLKQGQGTGEGVNYKPWLCVRDVGSFGLCHRIMSGSIHRKTPLMSNLERAWFFCFDCPPSATDIRD